MSQRHTTTRYHDTSFCAICSIHYQEGNQRTSQSAKLVATVEHIGRFGLGDIRLCCGFFSRCSAGVGVVVGDVGQLHFLDLLAGWFSEFSNVRGTSLATLPSTFMVSRSGDWFKLLPKDGARLSDLEVAGVAKGSAHPILWTRGLSGYREAGSDELDKEENERWSPGYFFVVEAENRDGLALRSWRLRGITGPFRVITTAGGGGIAPMGTRCSVSIGNTFVSV